jgi:hypothetical protein
MVYRNGAYRCTNCGRQVMSPIAISWDLEHPDMLSEPIAQALDSTGRCFWDVEAKVPRVVGDDGVAFTLCDSQARGFVRNLVYFHPAIQSAMLGDHLRGLRFKEEMFRKMRRITPSPEFFYKPGPNCEFRILEPGYNEWCQVFYSGPHYTPNRTGALDAMLDAMSFENGQSRINYKAWLLSLLCPTMCAPYPMLVINADDQGSGKTTLADIAGQIVMGRTPATGKWNIVKHGGTAAFRNLMSCLLDGHKLICFDNVVGKADSALLAEIITKDTIDASALYRQGNEYVKNDFGIIMTSNYARLSLDLCSRAIAVKLCKRGTHPRQWSEAKWKTRRKEVIEDMLAILAEGPVETGVADPDHRFPNWQEITRWVPGVVPIPPAAGLNNIDYEIDALYVSLGDREFSAADLWSMISGQRKEFSDFLQGAYDAITLQRRLENIVGKPSFNGRGKCVILKRAGEKFKWEAADAT